MHIPVKKLLLSLLLALLVVLPSQAYKLKEISVWSKSMNRNIPVSIITPIHYKKSKEFPVVYILHGFSDNYTKWSKEGVVGELADHYGIIVVMPDGGYDSWYFDSPVKKDYCYETFVSHELVSYVDSAYSTIRDRAARAITGQSMGGHGAFYVALKHQDVFGNVGSLSGGLDIRPFPKNWNIAGRLGSYEEFPQRWNENTVINMTHLLKPGSLNIVFECGTEDFFYKVNVDMHHKLLNEKIPHDFTSRPGRHNWTYWFNGIKYQFLFFNDRFKEDLKNSSK